MWVWLVRPRQFSNELSPAFWPSFIVINGSNFRASGLIGTSASSSGGRDYAYAAPHNPNGES